MRRGRNCRVGLPCRSSKPEPVERDRQAEVAIALLSNVEGVEAVNRVPDSELETLIAPWLGSAGAVGDAVPIPALIDVRLSGPVTDRRLDQIRGMLRARTPRRASRCAIELAATSVLGDFLAPVAGARPRRAARRDQRGGGVAARRAARSARIAGRSRSFTCSAEPTARSRRYSSVRSASTRCSAERWGSASGWPRSCCWASSSPPSVPGMVAGGGLGMFDWAAIAAIPIAGVVIAMFTARITVLAALRKMLREAGAAASAACSRRSSSSGRWASSGSPPSCPAAREASGPMRSWYSPAGRGGSTAASKCCAAARRTQLLVTGVYNDVKPREFAAEYNVDSKLMECCITLGFVALDTKGMLRRRPTGSPNARSAHCGW